MNIMKHSLTFDDILLIPRYSEVLPNEVNLKIELSKSIQLDSPILSAAMDSVTETRMAIAIAQIGGIGVIHKNMTSEKQLHQIRDVKAMNLPVAAAVGIANDAKDHIDALVKSCVDMIVIDTAHGHSKLVIELARWIKKEYPDISLIAGNIATSAAAKALAETGVDAVKVGIGPGSICTTRVVTGVGIPQVTAIIDVVAALKESNVKVIADGGIRYSGDIAKAIAVGADAVMLGSLLAGTDEAPGDIVIVEGERFKSYRGMGSMGAISESADRYFQHNTQRSKLVPEGIEGRVSYKGPASDVLNQLTGGLRSAMGYLGCKDIKELQQHAEFTQITSASMKESHPHNVKNIKDAPNYKT
jgi:IMP dehydrogenase